MHRHPRNTYPASPPGAQHTQQVPICGKSTARIKPEYTAKKNPQTKRSLPEPIQVHGGDCLEFCERFNSMNEQATQNVRCELASRTQENHMITGLIHLLISKPRPAGHATTSAQPTGPSGAISEQIPIDRKSRTQNRHTHAEKKDA